MGYRRLGRRSGHRRAMLRSLVTSLLREGRVCTTATRAKELRRLTEKMITRGKQGDLHAYRQVLAFLWDESVAWKLFHEIAPRYQEKKGGYTRLLKVRYRRGDGAELAIVELV